MAVDHLAVASWQRSKDGDKPSKRPKPIPRPGIDEGGKKYGDAGALTPAETRRILDRLKSKQPT